MSRVRKYLVGEAFETTLAAAQWILAGNWTMFHGHPMHPSWASNWSLSALHILTGARGGLKRATLNPDWHPPKSKQETDDE